MSWASVCAFDVQGEPKGQPRPRAFVRNGHASVYDGGTAEGWKSSIAIAVLRPFRTFRQIEQPSSSFLFRYCAQGDDVVLSLIEADGGAWKHEAMENIANYFKEQVPELKVIA